MAEYIEREALCYQLAKQATIDGQPRAIKRAAKIVVEFPAADVRPVRRGKWSRVYDDFMKSNYDTCSCCGKEYFGANGFNFCPNCGAMMEE